MLAIKQHNHQMIIRNHTLDFSKKTIIMGILNVTPDSFSDGGCYNRIDVAVSHALEMIRDGADIIDIGGESTRPGSDFIPLDIELERIIPVIKAIRKVSDIPISVDTYKAEAAKQALEAGADIINDVWGAKKDPNMASIAASYNAPIILMHNRDNLDYQDLLTDMKNDLLESINLVKNAGLADDKIIIDPGVGFAKTYNDNLKVMNNLEAFHSLGYPLLLGTSRKRFIGKALGTTVNDRMEGTGATVCLAITKGCQMVRVHDVKSIAQMAKMMDIMLSEGEPIG
ncbi:dihydropteroate synthase [Scopulibacillus daqui]|uniref:Dihydropteroate synthase n=1 Tax=Scopulibacillus daqui TaxID=1469162 RepID=A0ABS2Q3P6_9BACL|nr:dihydropteroate synthase [Scopulibacillus daqui]MBM7646440.1 dihydropteroate synthase [Scopulibacillus daqui]